jgi:hypothetical protein
MFDAGSWRSYRARVKGLSDGPCPAYRDVLTHPCVSNERTDHD